MQPYPEKEDISGATTRVHKFRRAMPSIQLKRHIASLNGYRCAFPGCNLDLMIDKTAFIGQLAAIEAIAPGGPRYNLAANPKNIDSPENYLLLCPNHHTVIDRQPDLYTVGWLKQARDEHLKRIAETLNPPVKKALLDEAIEISISDAIDVWKLNQKNSSEEFWQKLFQQCPAVIAQVFPRSMFQFGSKCYVGGKTVKNSGGNLVDFIYASKFTSNVVLVEIKTPETKLLGKAYRGVHTVSEELTGSLIQVLNYRDQLLKEYYRLASGEESFAAFNPKCLIISGTIDSQIEGRGQMRSLELFRNSLSGVEIITYDELFQKAQDTLEIVK